MKREDGASVFETDKKSYDPGEVLAGPQVWLSGDGDLDIQVRYRCIDSDGNNQPGCALGDPSGPLPINRDVYLYYTVGENETPTLGSNNETTLAGQGEVINQNAVTFEGTIASSVFDDAQNGDPFRFFIHVPMEDPPSGGDCTEECLDPLNTDGLDYYEMALDISDPGFLVGDPTNANSRSTADEEWYLYSNENLSNFLPTLQISGFDNNTGAPLDLTETVLKREGEGNNTDEYDPETVDPHTVNYLYDYTSENAKSFRDDRVTLLDVLFKDEAGNLVDTHDDDERGIWVVMDITEPDLELDPDEDDEGGSLFTVPPGREQPIGVGTPARIHVNATDIGANQDHAGENLTDPFITPPEILTVEARLFVENTTFVSDWVDIPFNKTRDDDEDMGYFWNNFTVPEEWTSGITRAEIRVTDPAGNTNQSVIRGNVTVDADFPILRPQTPIGIDDSQGFSSEDAVEFLIKAWHPADTDPWDGDDTGDRDNLGIHHGSVKLHYRIGQDGATKILDMEAQDEPEDAFAATRDTFDDEDEVYFYFSVKSLSGVEVTYPAAGDPHVTLSNATRNDGRFLQLQMDRVAPEIETAFDHSFVGGPGDHRFALNITDEGAGVDPEEMKFHWRLTGDSQYEEADLEADTVEDPYTGLEYTAFTTTVPRQNDGDVIEYYVEADDRVGNSGSLGSSGSPESATVDLTPPTVTVTSPEVSDENQFNVTWQGQDEHSGVRDYTLQFRVEDGRWITIPERERTKLTEYEICAATDRTYDFRVSVRDLVGNERGYPEVADSMTRVDAPDSCAEPPTLTIDAPADGATLSGEAEIRWRAVSTIYPDDLDVDIQVGGRSLVEDQDPAGSYTWNTALYDPNDRDPLCFEDGNWPIRITARDPASMDVNEEITVTLANGRDSCEPQTTIQEGPAPFEPLYLLVVLAFVGLAAIFAVGMARRW